MTTTTTTTKDLILFSLGDVSIRQSDLDTVEDGFLSDMIISYSYELLEKLLPIFKSKPGNPINKLVDSIALIQASSVFLANTLADEGDFIGTF
jgi:hypothetical protein